MSEERRKPGLKKEDKHDLLNELENLSGMLDDDEAAIEKELTQPYDLEDLPVLKTFVEDVPTLNETLDPDADAPKIEPRTSASTGNLDDSFVDDDPLAISPTVRQQRSSGVTAEPTSIPPAEPPTIPTTQATPLPTPPMAPTIATKPTIPKSDNPFLPKSALERIKNDTDAAESKVSQELRNLVKQRSLPNFSTNSPEYIALRNDASKMVNEVIKQFIPRIEAELRMRLENEIDEFLKELRKNAKD